MMTMALEVFTRAKALDPTETAPREARRWIAERLTTLGYPRMVEDAQVIVSEVVTNAFHATLAAGWNTKILVYLGIYSGHPVFECWDASTQTPEARDQDKDQLEEHGRGLHITRALARDVGWEITPSGKCVWAILQ